MSASPVVDMDRWRAKSRSTRSTAAQDAVVRGEVPAAPAAVLPLPAAVGQERYPGQVGPRSVFGPVMAFGLRARTEPEAAAASPMGVVSAVAWVSADSPVGPVAADAAEAGTAGVAVLPGGQEAPVAASWARGTRSRSRAGAGTGARTDTRGASRGPCR